MYKDLKWYQWVTLALGSCAMVLPYVLEQNDRSRSAAWRVAGIILIALGTMVRRNTEGQ